MRVIAFHKPYHVLTQFTDPEGRTTLKSFIDLRGIYAAGRLDYDSEGLLLLSDEGALIHRLTAPRHKLPKTYWAQIEGVPTEPALAALRRGLKIQDYVTQPCEARILPEAPAIGERSKPVTPKGPTAWLEIVLREGKKRQVRHMTAAVGLPTLRLLRVAIGGVKLGELAVGAWRQVSVAEAMAPTLRR